MLFCRSLVKWIRLKDAPDCRLDPGDYSIIYRVQINCFKGAVWYVDFPGKVQLKCVVLIRQRIDDQLANSYGGVFCEGKGLLLA